MKLVKIDNALESGVCFQDEDTRKEKDYKLGCDDKGNLWIVLEFTRTTNNNKYCELSAHTPNYDNCTDRKVKWVKIRKPKPFAIPVIESIEDAIKLVGSKEKLVDYINHNLPPQREG
jgi:hypothetical protein